MMSSMNSYSLKACKRWSLFVVTLSNFLIINKIIDESLYTTNNIIITCSDYKYRWKCSRKLETISKSIIFVELVGCTGLFEMKWNEKEIEQIVTIKLCDRGKVGSNQHKVPHHMYYRHSTFELQFFSLSTVNISAY